MRARIHLLAAVVVALLVTSGAALAQSSVRAASSWGLVGTWRVDCSQPRSRSNADLKYVVRDGKLFHDRDFGDSTDTNSVTSAKTKPDGTLELVVSFSKLGESRRFSFMKGRDGRIRAMFNRSERTKEASVLDGKFTSNGQPTPWQTRCY
jgi:hypothetical protein